MTVLSLHGLTRHFGRRAVLRDVDLEVAMGESIALRGPNGSGKTTLLRIAAGSLPPGAGTVDRTPRAGFLPQDAPTYRELSVVDHLRFITKVHGDAWDQGAAIATLRDAGLVRMADRPAGTLSRGQRQRLALVMAMHGEPDLLLLDEPWTALDDDGADWLARHLDTTDAAILAAIHDAPQFRPDRSFTLQEGRLE